MIQFWMFDIRAFFRGLKGEYKPSNLVLDVLLVMIHSPITTLNLQLLTEVFLFLFHIIKIIFYLITADCLASKIIQEDTYPPYIISSWNIVSWYIPQESSNSVYKHMISPLWVLPQVDQFYIVVFFMNNLWVHHRSCSEFYLLNCTPKKIPAKRIVNSWKMKNKIIRQSPTKIMISTIAALVSLLFFNDTLNHLYLSCLSFHFEAIGIKWFKILCIYLII